MANDAFVRGVLEVQGPSVFSTISLEIHFEDLAIEKQLKIGYY